MAGKFLLDRLDYHRKQGNCRQSFKVEVAAIGSLESALTEFSRRNRKVPVTYDFSRVRLSFTKQAKQLPKYTSAYQGRALTNPEALIDALLLPEHKLMASLQLLCGCRTEGVGAPVRPVPGGNRLCLENFADAEGDIFPVRMDPASAAPVRQFWTKEKGGKIAVKYCPLSLADQVSAWLLTHPEGLGDDYANYLRAVNQAMHDTGQAVRGRGTRALRFNFAQRRLRQYFKAGFGDEEAKRRVSSEMSHNRPDITDGYYR
jgi:hypothetical protein